MSTKAEPSGKHQRDPEDSPTELQDRLCFLNTLLDTIPNPVFYKDAAGVYRDCNKAFAEQIIGLPREKIIGCSLFDLPRPIPPHLAQIYHRQDLALLRTPGTQTYESDVRCADGATRHFVFTKATFDDAAGDLAGIVGVMLDITDRKLAEEACLESEERYRRMFEDTVLGIFQSTEKGELLNVNPAFSRMFGYESPEALLSEVGANAVVLYADPADRARNIKQVMENQTPVKTETRYRRKDGSIFTGTFYGWQVRDEAGRFLHLEGCVEDITQRKAAEDALRESEKRSRFLASRLLAAQENERRRISLQIHDDLSQNLAVLKLQLVAIAGDLRRDQEDLQSKCRQALEFADRIIESARHLTRDLSPAIIEDLKLCASLQWMLHDFQHQTDITASLEMENIDGLFSFEKQLIIYRIFQEALSNIRKHAQARSVAVVVQRVNGRVVLQITDDGQGFDLQEHWDRHVSLRGMGLAAMDERARMLGGTLAISAQKGRGTRLTLTIPTTGTRNAQGRE